MVQKKIRNNFKIDLLINTVKMNYRQKGLSDIEGTSATVTDRVSGTYESED